MNVAVRAQGFGLKMRLAGLLIAAGVVGGCGVAPHVLMPDEQHVIDRGFVEYPEGFELRRYATGFTAPTALAFDTDGSTLVAQGERGDQPKIWRFPANGGHPSLFYPRDKQYLPVRIPNTWQMYGPIGGMVVVNGEVYVTHRDANDMGVVTALDSKGGHRTICAGFPTQGDGGLTDIAYDATFHKLWFACGSVTMSGVAGLDNVQRGWVRDHPEAHDIPYQDIELLGYKFLTINPMAGFFGPSDTAVTGTYQPFAQSSAIRVKGAYDGKPSGAVFSVALEGGMPTVEAWGIHDPRGIAITKYGAAYASIDGMDMRKGSTRPIKDDPDSVVFILPGNHAWLGWPDFSTTFEKISAAKYQPPEYMIVSYPQVRPLIDLDASHLTAPGSDQLKGWFPSLSGANKMAIPPEGGPFDKKDIRGNLIIAMSGDRTPWASGGVVLPHPVGFKVVCLRLDTNQPYDFIRNTGDIPGSKIDPRNRSLIERPVDVKFGPDGALYVLDAGRMQVRNGREIYEPGAGQIFRLVAVRTPAPAPAPSPATAPAL
jgi:hypothetical protein